MNDHIIIVGAGLCGSLLALRLAQKGNRITVYEKRPDMRKTNISAGRSINLALSDRGLRALTLAGIDDDIDALIIPMHGRLLHHLNHEKNLVKYSGREGEWINSISRGGLNRLLIEKAEATGQVEFYFDTECIDADLEKGNVTIKDAKSGQHKIITADVIFGTDGAGSAIRNAYLTHSSKYRFDFSIKYQSTGYKELEIPAKIDGNFRLEKNALHIWPRSGFMMIALPNLDASFTVTLFLPMEGENSFANLKTDDDIIQFFKDNFPSAYNEMPDLVNDFRTNPTSSLGTVKCYPWQVNGKFLLMGDAAHAVVPFYGQGMNASFEDVLVLDGLVEKYNNDWKTILPLFQDLRKENADAIGDLAVENEIEMRAATADPVFLLKRRMELHLEQKFSNYFSKYSMVTFREDLPYAYAMKKGRIQDQILMQYAAEIISFDHFDENEALRRLSEIEI
jgi:kynurenine 3-monooxygenase